MIRRKPDVVPPGNAVLGEHHSGVVARAAAAARDEAFERVRLQRADDKLLRTQRRRVVGCLHARGKFGRPRPEASGRWPSSPPDAARASRRRRHVLPAPAGPQNDCRRRPRRKCRCAWEGILGEVSRARAAELTVFDKNLSYLIVDQQAIQNLVHCHTYTYHRVAREIHSIANFRSLFRWINI